MRGADRVGGGLQRRHQAGVGGRRLVVGDEAWRRRDAVAAGDVATADGRCDAAAAGALAPDTENRSTTNLTVADRWGNVVGYRRVCGYY